MIKKLLHVITRIMIRAYLRNVLITELMTRNVIMKETPSFPL